MPTVLRRGGFRVVVYLPPREHDPPHVHVRNADGEVIIELATPNSPQRVWRVAGMKTQDILHALRLVETETDYLRGCWRRYHGEEPSIQG